MFVVIDGPDGSGKTTLAKQLVKRLQSNGVQCIYTYEPTYESSAGIKIRDLLKNGNFDDIYSFTDLFVEDRKEHLKTLIVPALERGEVVVCDRYKYSALAYQQLQGVDTSYLVEINKECLIPDFVFVLLPHNADILLQRISHRNESRDVFEEKAFLTHTLELYKKLSIYFPEEKIFFLDAEIDIKENIKEIISIINKV